MKKEIVSEYARLVHQINRLRNKHIKGDNKELMILWYISKNPNCTPQDIAIEFAITPQMVSGMINHFEELEYIYRKVNKEDKRKFNLDLTKLGKSRTESLTKLYFSEIEALMLYIGEEDALKLLEIYEKIKKYYMEVKV